MSNTRRAEPGKPIRQERYASSEEFNRGLMGNLVARRCSVVQSPADRELIYFVQFLSHREGGLKSLAADLLKLFPEHIGTETMRRLGLKPKQVYDRSQVLSVRSEIPSPYNAEFPVRGDIASDIADFLDEEDWAKKKIDDRPESYPASAFAKVCSNAVDSTGLERALIELCCDPSVTLENCSPWWFSDLTGALRKYLAQWVEDRRQATVVTKIGELVYDTLDYVNQTGRLAVVDGLARTGKTFSAKAWCEQRPGRARYVQVPSTSDEIGFYRSIAKSLGVSININSKAQELRQRIEDALQFGHLVVVFDEAHYLWPNLIDPHAMPARINWIMTALVNSGVPVALITTPQFFKNQKAMENRTRWNGEQFTGRIGHYEKLPNSLPKSDLESVARAALPEGDEKSIELLACYAQGSAKYLAGIDSVVCRARFLASKEGRGTVSFRDLKQAIQQSVIPSDSALAQAMDQPVKRSRRGIAAPLQESFSTPEEPSQTGLERSINFADQRSAKLSVNRVGTSRLDHELLPG